MGTGGGLFKVMWDKLYTDERVKKSIQEEIRGSEIEGWCVDILFERGEGKGL
jgi:hypothetical protein